jgi:hypothetical protein
MNKRPLTAIVRLLLRVVFSVALLFVGINMIRFAHAQPQSHAGESHNDLRAVGSAKTFVKVHDSEQRTQVASPPLNSGVTSPGTPSGTICGVESRAAHGQVAPNTNGGTLNPVAFVNPTTVNASGRVAFNSQVDGSDRNQGVFVADADSTITAIAIGCGGLGGGGDTTSDCGDVSPIGGHFGGFFFGTPFTPDINDAGDVLFMCDVNGGDSRRALFLYQAASGQIVKVAAVGDPSPIGGTFGAVGPGSINNNGKILFLASPVGDISSDIFMWDNGTVTKVAARGDPAPGGGTFSFLGTESFGFQDGTSIPTGPVPDINDSDQIAFKAIVSGGITERGLIVRTGQTDEWYVKVPDPTPIGGTYFDMQAASINNAGQIAFFSDYRPTPDTFNSGWFAGAPGNWRKVVVFFDPIDGGECLGLAVSRNPMQTIDAAGNVVFWANLDSNGTSDRLVLGLTDGNLLIGARRGDPTPIGGTFGSMDAWPAINGNIGTLNVATPGAQNGALSAHMAFNHCPSGTPTPTASPTATPSASPTPTATPTPSVTPSVTPTPTATATATATPSITPIPTPTGTPTATPSVTPRPTPTPRSRPTPRVRPTPPG